ncbi:MAG: fibronectin type III domain-containing protein [Acidimicrobiaceae bacterium]|nr:fibronectin type III domain-containing protein [Acidimicrobiaceae bacterium]
MAPAQPDASVASVSGTTATVTWATPSDDGGSVVTGFVLQSSVDGGSWSEVTTTGDTSAEVADLTPGGAVWFRVRATNTVGASPLSLRGNTVTVSAFTTTIKMKLLWPEVEIVGNPVVLIGCTDLDPQDLKKMDTEGHFGGPYPSQVDPTLATQASEVCDPVGGITPSDLVVDEWVAYLTDHSDLTMSGDGPLKFIHKITPDLSAVDDDTGGLVMFSGIWYDNDGNDIADVDHNSFIWGGMIIAPIPIVAPG